MLVHLYTMILQFPPCFLKNQDQLWQDQIWAVAATQSQMKCFLAGMLHSDFLDSVIHSFIWAVHLPSVGVDLIFSIALVRLYTFGCSVPFSCIIQ